MGAFASIVQTMMEMNIFHLFFPWLMMLAIIYGVLDKYSLFEEASINGTLAFSVATLSMGGIFLFIPAGLFTNLAAALAFSVMGILGMVILLAMAGVDVTEFDNPEAELPGIIAITLGILSFVGVFLTQVDLGDLVGAAAGQAGSTFDQVIMPILVLVFLLIVISLVTPSGD